MLTELDIQTSTFTQAELQVTKYSSRNFVVRNDNRYKIYVGNPTVHFTIGDVFLFTNGTNANILYTVLDSYDAISGGYIIVDKELDIEPNKLNDADYVVFTHVSPGVDAITPFNGFNLTYNIGDYIYINDTVSNNGVYTITYYDQDYVLVNSTLTNETSIPATWWVGDSINEVLGYKKGFMISVEHQNYERLDLFQDENIQLNLKQIDIIDISKNFADYTQTFNIPASPKNNLLLGHYYNVDSDNQLNANLKIPSRLLIDSIPFRYGKLQLEKVTLDNGKPEQYSLTFYTNLVKLKDLFGDDLISNLDKDINGNVIETGINIEYTDQSYLNYITGTTVGDVIMPMISTTREWQYGNSDVNDIRYSGGTLSKQVTKTELLPAINKNKIIDLIKSKYNVDFTDNFIKDNLYLWCNKKNNISGLPFYLDYTVPVYSTNSPPYKYIFLDLTTDIFTVNITTNSTRIDVRVTVNSVYSDIKYTLDLVNLDGVVIATGNNTTTIGSQVTILTLNTLSQSKFKSNFKIRITQYSLFQLSIDTEFRVFNGFVLIEDAYSLNNTQSSSLTTSNAILSLPNMKVYDFITSLIKVFNLVILPDAFSENKYLIKPLNEYLTNGNEVDLTEYVNKDKIIINRNQIYKNLTFTPEKNDLKYNNDYLITNGREYGAETLKNIKGGNGDYAIESKFAIVRNTQLSIFPIARGTDKDLKFIADKPVLFMYGGHIESTSANAFGYNLNGVSTQITQVPYMGSDNSFYGFDINKDNLLIKVDTAEICGVNFSSGGPDNGYLNFTGGGILASSATTGNIVFVDDKYYEITGTIAANRVTVKEVDNKWFDLVGITSKPYTTHNVKLYQADKNYWRCPEYTQSLTYSQEYDYQGILRDESLYKNYYQEFIDQLYDVKSRTWEFEAELPASILYNIDLSSTIKISDKRYSILEININLLNGKSNLKLINYLKFSQGSKELFDNREDDLNELNKYNIKPSTNGVTFFNGLNNTFSLIYSDITLPSGTENEYIQVKANQNQSTIYDIEFNTNFRINFISSTNQFVKILHIRGECVIDRYNTQLVGNVLTLDISSKQKGGQINDIFMILPN